MRYISYPELNTGDTVQFQGALFKIISTAIYPETEKELSYVSAVGEWLSGNIVQNYFGPNKNWNFQGNINSRCVCI